MKLDMKHIKAVLFDKDGTLFNFDATWADWTRRVIMRLNADETMRGRLAEACGYDWAGNRFVEGSIIVNATGDETAAAWMAVDGALTRAGIERAFDAEYGGMELAPVCDLAAVLGELRARGLVLGIATNDAEANARAHTEQAGVADMFDFIAGCDSGFGAKPDAGMVRGFARAVGVTCEQVAMVGDSTHDLRAGRAAGAMCVGVLSGPAGRADLEGLADVVLADIGGLLTMNR